MISFPDESLAFCMESFLFSFPVSFAFVQDKQNSTARKAQIFISLNLNKINLFPEASARTKEPAV